LATAVCLGDPTRFRDGKARASDVGLIPSDYSSGSRQRLGSLSKQGNPFLRVRWCDATLHAARLDPAVHRVYRRKLGQHGVANARVATARSLSIRLWMMLRDQITYDEFCRRGARPAARSLLCGSAPREQWSSTRVTGTLIGRPASLAEGVRTSHHGRAWPKRCVVATRPM